MDAPKKRFTIGGHEYDVPAVPDYGDFFKMQDIARKAFTAELRRFPDSQEELDQWSKTAQTGYEFNLKLLQAVCTPVGNAPPADQIPKIADSIEEIMEPVYFFGEALQKKFGTETKSGNASTKKQKVPVPKNRISGKSS